MLELPAGTRNSSNFTPTKKSTSAPRMLAGSDFQFTSNEELMRFTQVLRKWVNPMAACG